MIWFTLPIRIVSEANSSEHWSAKAKRHRSQQMLIRMAFSNYVPIIKLPCIATLTRVAPRMLDDDNLVSSFKWIRDELADCFFPENTDSYVDKKGKIRSVKGRNDSNPLVGWRYAQRKGGKGEYAVEVLIDPKDFICLA